MKLKEDLSKIVGFDNALDDHEILEKYSKDFSFSNSRMPNCVTFPKDTKEVQEIVSYANRYRIEVTPRSSGVGFYGAGIPQQGGIIIDLNKMNRILKIDPENKLVKIEPGVNWGQLVEKLKEKNMMVCNSLFPHKLKSVVTTSMEREPILIPKSEYDDTFLTAEMVLPNGEVYWTGSAIGKGMASGNFPDCLYPGAKIFLGLQGTLGIVTWANIKAEWIPKKEKILFMTFKNIEEIAEPIYKIQRRMVGRECFVLNNFNFAAIFAGKQYGDFETLRQTSAPFILTLSLAGLHRHPEEKLDYEEEAVRSIVSEMGGKILSPVANIRGLSKKMTSMIREPWAESVYWKFRYKGSCHDVFFYTTLNRVKKFSKAISELSVKHEYPLDDIGFYLQPVEYGRACYCQYGFHYDPENEIEIARIRNLSSDASEMVLKLGGFFATPYGETAEMVYQNLPTFTNVMKTIKHVLDPNNIMNPGKF